MDTNMVTALFHARVAAYNLPPILVFSKSTPYFTGMLFHAQVAA